MKIVTIRRISWYEETMSKDEYEHWLAWQAEAVQKMLNTKRRGTVITEYEKCRNTTVYEVFEDEEQKE